jgi:enoyl-CoA hydratase
MMMTGRYVDAASALQLGLIDQCVPDEQFEAEVAALARDILANSWHTNRETKRLLRETEGMSLSSGLAHERYRHPGRAPDSQDRIAAFTRAR